MGRWTLNYGCFYVSFLVDIFAIFAAAMTVPAPLRLTFEPTLGNIVRGDPLTVRCEMHANSAMDAGTSVFLYCPIAPWGSFCFQNCKSACVAEEPGTCQYAAQLDVVTCRTVVEQNGHVTYEYTIPSLNEQWLNSTGRERGFYCKAAGVYTPQVWLTDGVLLDKPSTENVVSKAPVDPVSTDAQTSVFTTVPTVKVWGSHRNVVTARSALDEQTSAIMRELLIVFAIIVIFVSVSVNVFCCMRCALIRQYSKLKTPPRMQHLFCMTDEIRNARLAVHGTRDYWDGSTRGPWYEKPIDLQHLQQTQRNPSFTSDSRLLNMAPQTLLGTQALLMPPELLAKVPPQSNAFSDTNSNTSASVDVHTRRIKDGRNVGTPIMAESLFSPTPNASVLSGSARRSKTASLILVPGINGLQVMRAPDSSQNLLATAVVNYCIQQQQNLNELQKQLSSQEFGIVALPTGGGSDGMTSCMGSVGSPESIANLEQYQPSSSGMSTLREPRQLDNSSNLAQNCNTSVIPAQIIASMPTRDDDVRRLCMPNALLYAARDSGRNVMPDDLKGVNLSTEVPPVPYAFAGPTTPRSDSGLESGSGPYCGSVKSPPSTLQSNGHIRRTAGGIGSFDQNPVITDSQTAASNPSNHTECGSTDQSTLTTQFFFNNDAYEKPNGNVSSDILFPKVDYIQCNGLLNGHGNINGLTAMSAKSYNPTHMSGGLIGKKVGITEMV